MKTARSIRQLQVIAVTNVVKPDRVEKQEGKCRQRLDNAWNAIAAMLRPDGLLRDPNDRSRFDECKRVIIEGGSGGSGRV